MVDLISLIVLGAVIVVLLYLASGFFQIGSGKVGILTRKIWGKKMKPGQIVAHKGEIGVQDETLRPALYYRIPFLWNKKRESITNIEKDHIGIVESVDGEPLKPGRLLGDAVSCNDFQDAAAFYENHGSRGPQVAIIKPGQRRINTYAFQVTPEDATIIPPNKVGLISAKDGKSLPANRIIAPRSSGEHSSFQNGQAFLDGDGYRGMQLDVQLPGTYYSNPLLFESKVIDQYEVPPGYVVVLRSNVGEQFDPAKPLPAEIAVKTAKIVDAAAKTDIDIATVDESIKEAEAMLTSDKESRGIYNQPLSPGIYPLNRYAYTPYPVVTSAITVDWGGSEAPDSAKLSRSVSKDSGDADYPFQVKGSDAAEEFYRYNQLRVISKDGFELGVDVKVIIRIEPKDAPFIIARFGTPLNLIEQIVRPLIDSSFRNNAGQKNALDFVSARVQLQDEALKRAQEVFEKYRVIAQNLLISNIEPPQELLKTQTDKQIAVQQQAQFKEQANAQEQNIALQEKTARAQKQPEVVQSILDITINENKAIAQVKQAEGIRDSTKTVADGTAYQTTKTGEAQANAYLAQVAALGGDKVAAIKVVEELAAKGIRITPDILVTGGKDGDQTGALLATYLTTLLKGTGQGPTRDYKPSQAEQFKSELAYKQPVSPPAPDASMTSPAPATPPAKKSNDN